MMLLEVAADFSEETLSGLGRFALFHAKYAGLGTSYLSSNHCFKCLTCSGENH